jgi:hypothetical protein
MRITGTYYHDDGRSATFEVTEDGEHCLVVVKHAGSWLEGKSLRAVRWQTLDKLTDQAFKASIPDSDTPRWDTSRKVKPTQPRPRRRFSVQGYRDRTETREDTP